MNIIYYDDNDSLFPLNKTTSRYLSQYVMEICLLYLLSIHLKQNCINVLTRHKSSFCIFIHTNIKEKVTTFDNVLT